MPRVGMLVHVQNRRGIVASDGMLHLVRVEYTDLSPAMLEGLRHYCSSNPGAYV
jgi:hypothetical protein